jgi:ABC-type xylose transport system permease subunit
MNKTTVIKSKRGIFDDIKNKLVDIALDYAKKNIESSKKEIASYLENKIKANIEMRVKKELKRYSFLVFSLVLLLIGVLLLVYSLFGIFGAFFEIPIYIVNLAYSLILLSIGSIVFIIYK